MKVQSRYVEYSGGKRVVEGVWYDFVGGNCPEGCMDVGFPLREVRKLKVLFEKGDKKSGNSNFEYRITEYGEIRQI